VLHQSQVNLAPVQRTNSWRGPDRQALNSSPSTDNYRGDRRTRWPHHSRRRSLGRPCKVGCLELQQSFLQFQTPYLFRLRCAVNPMTLWLRRSTKDAFRLFVSGRNQVLTGQHRMRLTPDPDRGTNTKITFAIVGPLVQSYKWTTTNWPFERYGPRSPTHLDGYGT
jgi:hypothetical protein